MRFVAVVLSLLFCQHTFSQDFYLFAGTYTKQEKSKGIYLYTFDSKTGDTKLVSTTFTENPSFLALSRDAKHLYAVNENAAGKDGVSAFAFDHQKGRLQLLNREPGKGDDPCYLSIDPSGRWIVTANYSGGNFSVFPVRKNGRVGPVAEVIQHTGSGANPKRQEKAHVHSTVFTPDGHYLAVADLGMDQVTVYPFDAASSTPLTDSPAVVITPPGSGPRHITFNPSKPFAYLIDELAGNITVYKYSKGKLDSIQVINSYPQDYSGNRGSAAVHLSADGKFLYTSNRENSNSISIFSVDRSSGMLKHAGMQSTGGDHPREFVIDPSGKFLLVGNMKSGNIQIFYRNVKTGLLKDSGRKISIPEPAHLLFTHIR